MKQSHSLRPLWLPLLALALMAGFYLLDSQGVSTGDDLGYMFADSALHSADGKRIESVGDIIATQKSHYINCNGRVLTHSAVQFFLNLTPRWVWLLANSLMFGLLWVLSCIIAFGRRGITPLRASGMALLLCLFLPMPGVIMLSLTAYAINYMWVAAVSLAIIILWFHSATSDSFLRRTHGHRKTIPYILLFIACFIAGQLQESFSLPLIATMGLSIIIQRRRINLPSLIIFASYSLGTLLLLCSPGNWQRTGNGSGFSPDEILRKTLATLSELPSTGIPVALAIIIFVYLLHLIASKGKTYRLNAIFSRKDLFLTSTLLFSLLLCFVSFTASRQLFFPSLLAAILAARILAATLKIKRRPGRIATVGILLLLAAIFCGAYTVRSETARRMDIAVTQIQKGQKVVAVDSKDALYNNPGIFNFIFRRFNDDPFEGKYLAIMFDTYTKRGLVRLYTPQGTPQKMITPLPAPTQAIRKAAANSSVSGDGEISTVAIDSLYAVFYLPADMQPIRIRTKATGHSPAYERYRHNDTVYFIVRRDVCPLRISH